MSEFIKLHKNKKKDYSELPLTELDKRIIRQIERDIEENPNVRYDDELFYMAKGGKVDFDKVKTKYATQDINLLQKEGVMAITDTKKGVLFGEHKGGVFSFTTKDGKNIFSGNKQEAIEFVKDNYQVEQMADGGKTATKSRYAIVFKDKEGKEITQYITAYNLMYATKEAKKVADIYKMSLAKVYIVDDLEGEEKNRKQGKRIMKKMDMMADGGISKDSTWYQANYKLQNGLDSNMNFSAKSDREAIKLANNQLKRPNAELLNIYLVKGDKYTIVYGDSWESIRDTPEIGNKNTMANGGMMADGGEMMAKDGMNFNLDGMTKGEKLFFNGSKDFKPEYAIEESSKKELLIEYYYWNIYFCIWS
jgi:hypothetical protein